MRLLDLVYKSLLVRKEKSLFLIVGLSIGIVTIVTLLSATQYMQKSIDGTLKEQGVTLQISPKTEQLKVSFNGLTVVDQQIAEQKQIPTETLDALRYRISGSDIKMIEKNVALGYIGSKEAVIVVTDIKQELRMNRGWTDRQSTDVKIADKEITDVKAMIGEELIDQLDISNLKITYDHLEMTLNDAEYKVIEPQGNEYDSILFIDRSLMEDVSKINFVELHVKTDDVKQAVQLEVQLNEKFPELQVRYDWGSLQARQDLFTEFKNYTLFTIVMIITAGLFLVCSTMIASVNERNREFGILRASGYRKKHIVYVVFMETCLLFLIAYGIAVIIGALSSGIMIARIFDYTPIIYLSFVATVGVGIAGLLISILAAVYPAAKAANLDPVDAVR